MVHRYLYILIIIIGLFSCKPQQVMFEKTFEITRDTTIILPPAIIYDTITIKDSVFMNTFNERVIIDSTSKAKLTFYKSAYNQLIARCEAMPQVIRVQDTLIKKVPFIVPNNEVNKRKNNVPNWVYYLGGLLIILVVISSILKKII